MNGNSPEKLSITRYNGEIVLEKAACGVLRARRLREACEMQIESEFKTPKVVTKQSLDNFFSFSMEYIRGYCGHEIPEFCDYRTLHVLRNFFESYIEQIMRLPVSDMREHFSNKLAAMSVAPVSDHAYLAAIDHLETHLVNDNQELLCPTGRYHGDLTLSNLLISKSSREIYLIDFLPSFANTPLLDVAKIEQDLTHKWSFRHKVQKSSRVDIALQNLLPAELIARLETTFPALQVVRILNVLRIFPYVTDPVTHKWCSDALEKEMDNL